MKPELREYLKTNIITGDGAMGTYLYHLGFPVGISYEEFNIIKPDVIADVHRKYYEAGARLIETNTFTATREKLSKYGLENEVRSINLAGVNIARSAVGEDAYVVGAIGSIRAGRRNNITTDQLKRDFEEQIEALLEGEVDGFILETFFDLDEAIIPIQIIRSKSDLPIICQFAVEDVGRTSDGFSISEAFQQVREHGADIVGLNCRSGPNLMIRTLENISRAEEVPLSVFPNAGIPDYVDGEYTYMASPEYFAQSALHFAKLGAKIIGGCCGTTPEHISAISEALKEFDPQDLQYSAKPAKSSVDTQKTIETNEIFEDKKPSIVEIVKQRHTVIVELDPPRDLDISKFMKGSEALKQVGADAVTMADNSLAVTRMSNLALGQLIKEKHDVRPLVHIACRDRNLIGSQTHMMGLHALGIDHVLAVTGDPARFGDLPGSSSVYDTTSFEMIRMIKQLNEGISFSGKPLKQKANFVVGAAFNPNVKYLDKAVKRLERKIEAGADYIMTQPVYDAGLIKAVFESTKHLNIPIFIGIMPLASGRNAEYLHNEVPGIQLSDEVRKRMSGLSGEEGRREGVEIAKELLNTAIEYFKGIYLITPFMSYQMTAELTEYVWMKTNRLDSHLYPISK
ncbi:bifunctional homocysteine S-methyltransferase/methylenetetrahydrofolate reductase [Chengkuizengella axinellae]|uniref:Bifunctional homocysteine S-methyltransferase/methylenetetrahydrofolate reductase n=1 Tax=Chengkuizengella axinellae TaxID=3064388 RepID=A0ABT9IVK0_9BACL|nr:bifunctional homocysteine S-methyltransferase/methylenetetrahydrofolate reductase [Chengkuizengella sp. 2205SS18-9]MDP5273357.1 bifunctional homocysteine S-methyltransferase/methylenetetrahydrofolate reductase [Chengkuizengella sp. 2205SS18-9]